MYPACVTPEREALLLAEYALSDARKGLVGRLNALPGKSAVRSCDLPPWKRDLGLLSKASRSHIMYHTPERDDIVRRMYPRDFTQEEIVDTLNAYPGPRMPAMVLTDYANGIYVRRYKRPVALPRPLPQSMPLVAEPMDIEGIYEWGRANKVTPEGDLEAINRLRDKWCLPRFMVAKPRVDLMALRAA